MQAIEAEDAAMLDRVADRPFRDRLAKLFQGRLRESFN